MLLECAKSSLPENLILEIVFAKDLIQHHLHVMRGVPIAVIVKAAGLLENTSEF